MCDFIELPKSPSSSLQDNDIHTELYSPPTPPESINHQNSVNDPNLDPELNSKDQIISYLTMKYQEEQNRHFQEVAQLKTQLSQHEKTALDNKLAYDRMKTACRKWKDKHDAKSKLLEEKEEVILKNDVRISELENLNKRKNESHKLPTKIKTNHPEPKKEYNDSEPYFGNPPSPKKVKFAKSPDKKTDVFTYDTVGKIRKKHGS